MTRARGAMRRMRARTDSSARRSCVLLESGARVPADLRLSSSTALRVDESLLTGESLPVTKTTATFEQPERPLADRTNMAYTGSAVASGRGRGYVVATAARTELGAIAESIRTEGETETPLQHRMHRFAQVIGVGVAVSSSLAFAMGLALGESPSHVHGCRGPGGLGRA